MAVVMSTVEDIQAYIGQEIGHSDWTKVTFEQIQMFADATLDQQWIHTDRARAEKESPYGAPIAHGYLTLSLVAGLFFQVLRLDGFKMVINYGCNKVRFPAPVIVDNNVRLRLTLQSARQIKASAWWEMVMIAVIEIEGSEKPAAYAEAVYRVQSA
ncbi:MAG: MaoC family dehydratase [Myxococcota bacterium]